MAPSLWPLVIAAWTETGISFLISKDIVEIIGEMVLGSLSLFIVLYVNFLIFMVVLWFLSYRKYFFKHARVMSKTMTYSQFQNNISHICNVYKYTYTHAHVHIQREIENKGNGMKMLMWHLCDWIFHSIHELYIFKFNIQLFLSLQWHPW
jgi:uncharacterized membrane protein